MHTADSLLQLSDDHLQIACDATTGALVSLFHKRTGWHIQRRPALGASFDLMVPLPERRANYVRGASQHLTRSSLDSSNGTLTLVWDRPVSEHGGIIDLTFTATARLDQGRLTFTSRLENRSPHVVETATWPILGDIPLPPGEAKLEFTRRSYGDAATSSVLPHFHNDKGYWGTMNPIQVFPTWNFQGALLNGKSTGLYTGFHDTSLAHAGAWSLELKPGYLTAAVHHASLPDEIDGKPIHVSLAHQHQPYAQPGSTTDLLPVVLAPYTGDRLAGFAPYRDWRATWFTPPPGPAWARGIHRWYQLHINSPEDELRHRYTDLPAIAAEMRDYGITALQLVGWNHGGQDRGNPFHDPDPRLGTWQELHDAIAAIKAMGLKVILFAKFTWIDRSHPWFKNEGHRHCTKDPYGDTHYYHGYEYFTLAQFTGINLRRFSPTCPLSPAWHAVVAREFRKLIALGADGMLFDENQHHGGVSYCFDPSHGHPVPAYIWDGDRQLGKLFQQIAAAEAPGFLIAGEDTNDACLPWYAMNYARFSDTHRGMIRWIDGHTPFMMNVHGLDDREQVNLGVLWRYVMELEPLHFKGRLSDAPRSARYAQQADALRSRWQTYLWHGTLQLQRGASVEHAEGGTWKPAERFNVFTTSSGLRAVVILNQRQDGAPLRLRATLPGAKTLRLVSPEDPEGRPAPAEFDLPARHLAVLIEETHAQK